MQNRREKLVRGFRGAEPTHLADDTQQHIAISIGVVDCLGPDVG
jgi:hypothetical protein